MKAPPLAPRRRFCLRPHERHRQIPQRRLVSGDLARSRRLGAIPRPAAEDPVGGVLRAGWDVGGQHTWTATTGSWDDWGNRVSKYTYSGTFTQPASGSKDVYVPDNTIQDLLSVPPLNLGYWEGYYFDASAHCYTTAFKFQENGTYTFYNSNTAVDSGTYTLVTREPAIFSIKFHVTGSVQNADGLLVENQGQFSMSNGPASWPQITYVYKPAGYVRNSLGP